MDNQCMMQYFEWNIPADGLLWKRAAAQAKSLHHFGVDIVWLPPAYKGAGGGNDVGYSVYDLYDLGEFDQKGSVRTKYGTKDEYLSCIRTLQKEEIAVLTDIVLDHRIGADETEQVSAEKYDPENRLQRISGEETIEAWTKFTFLGRKGKYSDFIWNWECFNGIDWDAKTKEGGVFQFEGKEWSQEVDCEKGNFDYLMGANVDVQSDAVAEELIRWGKWYLETTGADGFRLDAVKHIDALFYQKWLDAVRKDTSEDLFTVGEYWSAELGDLTGYLETSGERMSLFDVPLHFNFYNASTANGQFGMQKLFENALVTQDVMHAVTFVDNHDTQPGQALESWVEEWFKPLAYAAILLRKDGLPCVFYADYYGLRSDGVPRVLGLKRMMMARRKYAYGEQRDYFDHDNVVGWTRLGDEEHPGSGCAVLMTDKDAGEKQMYVGEKFAGRQFRDITRRVLEPVTVGGDGNATFKVPGGGVTVWLAEEAYEDIAVNCE